MHRQAAKFCLVASFFLAMITLARGEDQEAAPVDLVIGRYYQVKVQRRNVTVLSGGELAKANDQWLAFRRVCYEKRESQNGFEIVPLTAYVWVPRYAVVSIKPHPQNL